MFLNAKINSISRVSYLLNEVAFRVRLCVSVPLHDSVCVAITFKMENVVSAMKKNKHVNILTTEVCPVL